MIFLQDGTINIYSIHRGIYIQTLRPMAHIPQSLQEELSDDATLAHTVEQLTLSPLGHVIAYYQGNNAKGMEVSDVRMVLFVN